MSTDHAATRSQPERIDFTEHEQQITKSIEILCHKKLVLCSPEDEAYLSNNATRNDSMVEPELPDLRYNDIQIQKELAEALVRSARNIKPALLRDVGKMSSEYQAARNALAAVKKLREIFDVYKKCWDPETHDPEDR